MWPLVSTAFLGLQINSIKFQLCTWQLYLWGLVAWILDLGWHQGWLLRIAIYRVLKTVIDSTWNSQKNSSVCPSSGAYKLKGSIHVTTFHLLYQTSQGTNIHMLWYMYCNLGNVHINKICVIILLVLHSLCQLGCDDPLEFVLGYYVAFSLVYRATCVRSLSVPLSLCLEWEELLKTLGGTLFRDVP